MSMRTYFGIAHPTPAADRRLATTAAAATCATAASLALMWGSLAPAAHAVEDELANTGPCPGQVVATYPLSGQDAHLEISYSPADGGTNCARAVLTHPGVDQYVSVQLHESGNVANHNSEEGLFATYAGPVAITGTDGACITASANTRRGTAVIAGAHCG